MRRTSFAAMDCSIARTLEVVGTWWTPLVLREVFFGRRRFDEIQADLGIARNVLADRLAALVDHDVLHRHDIGTSGTRYEYRLTARGRELFAVLVTLMDWGDRWLAADDRRGPPTELVHDPCGEPTRPLVTCGACGGPLTADNVVARPGPGRDDDPDHPLVRARTARRPRPAPPGDAGPR